MGLQLHTESLRMIDCETVCAKPMNWSAFDVILFGHQPKIQITKIHTITLGQGQYQLSMHLMRDGLYLDVSNYINNNQSESGFMNIDQCIETVLQCNILPENTVKKLCKKVKALLFQESNVQPVQAPVTVCGDVHGQFYDLLELFQKGGNFQASRYIMIGDFVDRGYHSVETITLLFLYKLKFPDRLVLLRGNHESRNITHLYGFYDEINKKYGNQNVWFYFNDAFDYLPLAAIIEGALFCVHGGLSPKINTIDLMRSIERNVEIPSSGPLCDLMWSDPEEIETWQKNSRGAGWLFGGLVVKQFLQFNNLECIYRAHQLVKEGYKKHFNGMLVTVWSAPNYCYRMNNSAAIAKIDTSLQVNFIPFEAAPMSKKSQSYANLLPYFL